MTSTMPKIDAGKLRHLAALEAKTEVDDGGGGVSVTWSKQRDLWCWIRPISVVQRLESMRRQSAITHEIVARYEAGDITPGKRIVFETRAFNIEGVLNAEERDEFVTVLASEGRVAT